MGLNGLIVIDRGGTPIYTNLQGTKLAMDSSLVAGFFSAMQTFSMQMVSDSGTGINEMSLHNIKILYRQMESFTFVGIIDPGDNVKNIEPVLEHIICVFLAKFRKHLKSNQLHDISVFLPFNAFFEKWRNAKEKDLQKYCEKSCPTLLQGIMNRLVNFFPVSDLVKINPAVLKTIGKKLIWVELKTSEEEESRILAELKNKVATVYGPGFFENLEKDIKKAVEVGDLF